MGISVIKTLRSSSIEVLAILGIIGIMSVFFGVLIYFAELTAPDNSSNLSNVGDGVWFALITITTVGYGEISPSTILGRIMASFCGIIGVLIIAMVVPVVSNLYQEFYDRQKDAIDFVCLSTGRVVVVDEDDGISDGFTAMDIGPNSVDTFRDVMGEAKTVFWNGPVGVYEDLRFSHGTKHLLKSMAEATKDGVLTVIGGGDTAAAAAAFGFTSTLSHVSAGGGATLELLQGTELPGISILTDAVNLEHKSGSVPVKPTLKAHAK